MLRQSNMVHKVDIRFMHQNHNLGLQKTTKWHHIIMPLILFTTPTIHINMHDINTNTP